VEPKPDLGSEPSEAPDPTPSGEEGLAGLEEVLGVPPRPAALFLEAFTHPSYAHEQPDPRPAHNQRLEFLGDAVVGLVVAHELWRRFPDLPEGELTRRRIAAVNRTALAAAARRIGLARWLRLGRGHERSGGRGQAGTLSDLFEAVVGALFAAYGLPAAEEFVLRSLGGDLEGDRGSASNDGDPKTELQELLQALGPETPAYELMAVEGPPHAPTFTCAVTWRGRRIGVGQGDSKKAAEQAAAAAALRALSHGSGGAVPPTGDPAGQPGTAG